jgi:hypothetical protein
MIGWLVLGLVGWAMILGAILALLYVGTRRALRGNMEDHEQIQERRRHDA